VAGPPGAPAVVVVGRRVGGQVGRGEFSRPELLAGPRPGVVTAAGLVAEAGSVNRIDGMFTGALGGGAVPPSRPSPFLAPTGRSGSYQLNVLRSRNSSARATALRIRRLARPAAGGRSSCDSSCSPSGWSGARVTSCLVA
jgi:hypothetical protein